MAVTISWAFPSLLAYPIAPAANASAAKSSAVCAESTSTRRSGLRRSSWRRTESPPVPGSDESSTTTSTRASASSAAALLRESASPTISSPRAPSESATRSPARYSGWASTIATRKVTAGLYTGRFQCSQIRLKRPEGEVHPPRNSFRPRCKSPNRVTARTSATRKRNPTRWTTVSARWFTLRPLTSSMPRNTSRPPSSAGTGRKLKIARPTEMLARMPAKSARPRFTSAEACLTIPIGPASDAPPRPCAMSQRADGVAFAAALHLEPPRRRSIGLAELAHHVAERGDLGAVDRHHPVAGLQPRGGGRPAWQHLHASGGEVDEAAGDVEAGDDDEGEEVVDSGAGGDHEEAAPGRLVRVGARVGGVLGGRLVRREPGNFAIAAEGNGAQPIIGFAAPETSDARPEAERVRLHTHAEQAGEHQVACFVGSDEQPQADDRQKNGEHGGAVYSMHPRRAGTTFNNGRKIA